MTETSVISLEGLHKSFKKIRDFKEGFLTNLFINPFVTSIWIKNNLLTQISINKTDFFLRYDHDFIHIYYCSPSESLLKSDFSDFIASYNDKVFLLDIIGNSTDAKTIADLFLNNSIYQYTSLIRMARHQHGQNGAKEYFDANVVKAQDSDLMLVKALIYEYFDRYSDQLPHYDELQNWINKGNILLCKNINDIQGFIIFEDIGQTSYLRYWFVHPDYRELKIGSKLINSFFQVTQSASRHLFWVNSTNDNAIKRYRHYGFLPEDMIDIILINREIEYDRQNN